MSIDILLSTYNGELYLEEQINSLLKQTFNSWHLLIRDDGSVDNTRKIISKYCELYPEKIIEITDNNGNMGASLSFSLLLERSKSKYIMFCDQDDVWLEDKIAITYDEILKLEKQNEDLPLMVFTDLYVVDENLSIVNDSFMADQKLFSDVVNNVYKTLALNIVAGCTMMINETAKKFILPFPKFLIHDYWIGVNIVHYGKCKYINKKTILYRQHGSNVYGALEINFKYFFKKTVRLYKYLYTLVLLKKRLSFNISLLKILYYKIIITYQRL